SLSSSSMNRSCSIDFESMVDSRLRRAKLPRRSASLVPRAKAKARTSRAERVKSSSGRREAKRSSGARAPGRSFFVASVAIAVLDEREMRAALEFGQTALADGPFFHVLAERFHFAQGF